MLKIYGRTTSSNVMKVLWACEELGLPFERIDIGGPFGGNREPGYLAMNPNGLVPTIDDDGFTLWESNTILRYLGAKHGPTELWPASPREQADCDRWMDWQLTVLAPAITPIFLQLVRTPEAQRDPAVIEASRRKTIEALAILEGHLEGRDYVGGRALTLGDIPVGIMVHRWFALPTERPAAPRLRKYYERLAERSGYRVHVMPMA